MRGWAPSNSDRTGKAKTVKSKWSKAYWYDLAERVASTFLGALLAYIVTDNVLEKVSFEQLWPVLILPTLVSLIKGLLANLVEPRSGASMLPSPPGPIEVNRTESGRGSLDTLGYVLAGIGIILILLDLLTTTAGWLLPGLILLIAGVVVLVIGRTHTPH
jgi:hypothetical protein